MVHGITDCDSHEKIIPALGLTNEVEKDNKLINDEEMPEIPNVETSNNDDIRNAIMTIKDNNETLGNSEWELSNEDTKSRPNLSKFTTVSYPRKKYQQKIRIKTTFEGEGISIYKDDNKSITAELRRCKPYCHYDDAYVNSQMHLVIFTESREDDDLIRASNWPKNAFGNGVKIRSLSEKHSLAIKRVPTHINIDQELADSLYEESGIIQIVRISIKNDKQYYPTQTVKIETETDSDFLKIIDYGLYIGNDLYKAEPWEYEPTRCYNCQKFGHVSEKCKNDTACARCIVDHQGKCKSKQEDVQCRNCGGKHPTWSKICKKYIEIKCNMNTKLDDIRLHKNDAREARNATVRYFGQLKPKPNYREPNLQNPLPNTVSGTLSYASIAKKKKNVSVISDKITIAVPRFLEVGTEQKSLMTDKPRASEQIMNTKHLAHQQSCETQILEAEKTKIVENSEEMFARLMNHTNTVNSNMCAIISVVVELVAKIAKIEDSTLLNIKNMLSDSMNLSNLDNYSKMRQLENENAALKQQLANNHRNPDASEPMLIGSSIVSSIETGCPQKNMMVSQFHDKIAPNVIYSTNVPINQKPLEGPLKQI